MREGKGGERGGGGGGEKEGKRRGKKIASDETISESHLPVQRADRVGQGTLKPQQYDTIILIYGFFFAAALLSAIRFLALSF